MIASYRRPNAGRATLLVALMLLLSALALTDAGSAAEPAPVADRAASPPPRPVEAVQVDDARTQILVEARILSLDVALLREHRLAPRGGGEKEASPCRVVDADGVKRLLADAANRRDTSILSAPRLTLLDGQKGTISIGQEAVYIRGYKAVPNGPPEGEPQQATVATGISLDISAATQAQGKVKVHVTGKLSILRGIEELDDPDAPPGIKRKIQKPVLSVRGVETAVTLKDGQTLAIAGEQPEGGEKPGMVLWLIKASILPPQGQ